MTAKLVGSAIATVRVRPSRLSGRTRFFSARSAGIELHDLGVDLELREIDRRHLVLPGERLGELDLLDEAELDEVVPYARPVLALFLKRLVELHPGDEPLVEEEITNAFALLGDDRGSHVASALVVGFVRVKVPAWPPYESTMEGEAGFGHAVRKGEWRHGRNAPFGGADFFAWAGLSPALPRRGEREKVTNGARRRASAAPMPRTRSRPVMEPNGPFSMRSATMRRASAGPMSGSAAISSVLATSRSTGACAVADGRRRMADGCGCPTERRWREEAGVPPSSSACRTESKYRLRSQYAWRGSRGSVSEGGG